MIKDLLVFYLKVESISHDKVKLFYFGDHNSATDELKGNNYSGRSEIKLIPLSDLSEASLSGTYSFYGFQSHAICCKDY